MLLRDGRAIGEVPGAVLEAQYRTDAGDLLFVTHDIPFEEQLEILVIDAEEHLCDHVTLGGAYATGAFEPVAVIDDRTLRFRFFGGAPFEVGVLPRTVWRWPFSVPFGLQRHTRFRKQLEVRRIG